MESWSAHHLYRRALAKHDEATARALRDYAEQLQARNLAVVFTLGHLAKITGIHYGMLNATVNRKREAANYRIYAVGKRSGGRRFIHAVSNELSRVQQFINSAILQANTPHPCSFAFHESGGIRKCAAKHCEASWIFQYDLKDFFYDINEIDLFRVFSGMGYRALLAFELARLCTTTLLPRWQKRLLYHHGNEHPFAPSGLFGDENGLPYPDRSCFMGVLPQGAPTSPMLSNLAAAELDVALFEFAREHGFVYTRYADDITFSTVKFDRSLTIAGLHNAIIQRIRKARFRENRKKIRVAGPGSKKIVLGLLVDTGEPRLSKETYRRVDRFLYAASKFGWEATAHHEGFDSAFGFHNHLSGLIAFVKDVDTQRWEEFSSRLKASPVPWLNI